MMETHNEMKMYGWFSIIDEYFENISILISLLDYIELINESFQSLIIRFWYEIIIMYQWQLSKY